MIADSCLERIHHPYDGGSDVLLPTTAERDVLRHHARWLSSHPEVSELVVNRRCPRDM